MTCRHDITNVLAPCSTRGAAQSSPSRWRTSTAPSLMTSHTCWNWNTCVQASFVRGIIDVSITGLSEHLKWRLVRHGAITYVTAGALSIRYMYPNYWVYLCFSLWFSVLYVNNSICRPYYTHINAVCYGLNKNHYVRRLFGCSAVGLIANHVTICETNYFHSFVRLEWNFTWSNLNNVWMCMP